MTNSPTEGEAGQVVVQLAPGLRFVGVTISGLDQLRRTEDLARAFDRAYSEAIRQAAPAASRSYAGQQLTSKPRLRSLPPMPDPDPNRRANLQLINELAAQAGDSPGIAAATGVSGNQCVRVRLDAASSRGRLAELDQGWLSNAAPGNVTNAITEAFADAYEKRGNR